MSGTAGLRGGGPRVSGRPAGVLWSLSRIGAGPLMLRGVALGTGFAALLLAAPALLGEPRLLLAAAVLAAIAAIGVGTPWVSLLEHLAVVGWFAATTWYEYPISSAQALGLAAAIYLHHTSCALAAVLPLDAAVAPAVLVGWLRRAGGVLAVSLPLGAAVLALPDAWGRSGQTWLPIAGLAALLAGAYTLLHLSRAR